MTAAGLQFPPSIEEVDRDVVSLAHRGEPGSELEKKIVVGHNIKIGLISEGSTPGRLTAFRPLLQQTKALAPLEPFWGGILLHSVQPCLDS